MGNFNISTKSDIPILSDDLQEAIGMAIDS